MEINIRNVQMIQYPRMCRCWTPLSQNCTWPQGPGIDTEHFFVVHFHRVLLAEQINTLSLLHIYSRSFVSRTVVSRTWKWQPPEPCVWSQLNTRHRILLEKLIISQPVIKLPQGSLPWSQNSSVVPALSQFNLLRTSSLLVRTSLLLRWLSYGIVHGVIW